MNHWIVVASLDHVGAAVAGGFIQAGHGKRSAVARLHPGDRLVCYCAKRVFGGDEPYRRFVGLGTVAEGEVYVGEMAGTDFTPHRRAVDYDRDAHPAEVEPLREGLSFVTDSRHWGYAYRRGLFAVAAADFALIERAMRPS